MDEAEGRGAHEHVVTSLLDLQARLRGEQPSVAPSEAQQPAAQDVLVIPDAEAPDADVAVILAEDTSEGGEADIPVLDPPDPSDAEERTEFAPVTPLHGAAAPDDRIAGLADRLSQLERSLASVEARTERNEAERSERLVSLEQRLLHEVASQRRDLIDAIDERFVRLDEALRGGLAQLYADPTVEEPEPDQPA
jgi:hypothetical protein